MKISVIIPTYNEEKVIEECLKSLSKQSFNDLPAGRQGFEVVVVDDGSTDTTYKIVSKLKFTSYKLQIFKTSHLGAGGARNEGVKHAKGEILVFVDSDMVFKEDFLEKLVRPIILGKAKGTFSKDEYVSNWNNVWARCWNINEGWEPKKRHPRNYPDHQPVFRAILKSEFNKVGGFTPGGYNDDWSLSEKLGYEAVVAPKAFFYHKNPESLKEIFNHAKWVGKRKYKFGILGYLVGLVRSSFPVSIVLGIIHATFYMLPVFMIFKVVYDFGIFIGIINYVYSKRGSK